MDALRSYFRRLLQGSMHGTLELSPLAFEYLLDLLVAHAHSAEGPPVLAWCYRDAVNATGRMRFNAYRRLGDSALFLSGFFSRYVASTGGMGYYVDMGSLGYGQAATLSAFPVMVELSKKFPAVVTALNISADQTTLGSSTLDDAVELYMRHPTAISWRRLASFGAVPVSQGLG